MKRSLAALAACLILPASSLACVSRLPDPPEPDGSPLAVGATRSLELRYLRFDVTSFQKKLTRADIAALPDDVKERLWLLDLDLSNGPNTPHLLDNALAKVKELPPESLSPAARNMQALLRMTPGTAKLDGTSLEELTRLAPLIGVAPERCLADLLGIDVDAEFLSPSIVSEALLKNVIRTHPNARKRLGPRTPEHPDGIYDVAPAGLPVSLADAVADFATLPKKFGMYAKDGVYHPGFLAGESRAKVLGDDFSLTVRANANALPYKGVDLSLAAEASVSSIPSQIEKIFDFSDPGWLTMEGLVPGVPKLETITFRIEEDARFVPGGRSPLPAGVGASPAWQLAPWTLEHVLAAASRGAYGQRQASIAYGPEGRPRPLFVGRVKDGWQTIEVDGGLGSPPPPSYLWDMLLEVGQVRLHDGNIPEGSAVVELTLSDVPIGLDTEMLSRAIRDNLSSDARALLGIASQIVDSTSGEADLYYYRASLDTPEPRQGDWLFFVTDADTKPRADGTKRTYAHPGFYADDALTQKISTKDLLDGDDVHEKVQVEAGAVLYAEDDAGAVFRIDVRDKTTEARLSLDVTRVR